MNPIQIVQLCILAALVAGSGYGGWRLANDHRDALELADARGKAQALEATATALADLKIEHVTINRAIETQIKSVPVYIDCKNTPEVMETINRALTGVKP